MIRAAHEVVINRPIADVFAYLADGLNDPAWHDGILEIERASDVVGVGAMYRQTVRGLGGTRVPADYFVSEYEPPHLLAIEVTAGPVRPAGRFELSEDGPATTTLRSTLELPSTLAMKLMSGMITSEFEKEVRQIERLKTVLEAG